MNINQIPSLEALLTFREVARRLSFTGAARALSVTQGAVSHRIRRLEDHLGVRLFERSSRRVALTVQGRLLSAACEDAFGRIEEALDQLTHEEDEKRLVVSCSPSFAIRWLVPHLPQLQAELPGLEVLLSADDRLVKPGVDGVDLCIRYGPGGYPGLDVQRLSVEWVTPVCSPSLAERAGGMKEVDDLVGQVLLHDEVLRGHRGRVGWTSWLREFGGEGVDPRRGVRFSHAHLALEAALAGQGIALARGILVARDLAEGRLVAPFTHALESGLAYWVLSPSGAVRPAVQDFRRWLLDAVDEGL